MKVFNGAHEYRGSTRGIGRAARTDSKLKRALTPIDPERLTTLLTTSCQSCDPPYKPERDSPEVPRVVRHIPPQVITRA
jgi:hypothetical protein